LWILRQEAIFMVVEGGRRWKKGWAQFTSDITHATNRLEGLAVTFEISHGLRRSSDWFEEKGKKKRTNNILIFHSFFFFCLKFCCCCCLRRWKSKVE
jgi:hypothetical protein